MTLKNGLVSDGETADSRLGHRLSSKYTFNAQYTYCNTVPEGGGGSVSLPDETLKWRVVTGVRRVGCGTLITLTQLNSFPTLLPGGRESGGHQDLRDRSIVPYALGPSPAGSSAVWARYG